MRIYIFETKLQKNNEKQCQREKCKLYSPMRETVNSKISSLSNKIFLIIYSPPCHPRCSCLSFFSQKEIKVFDENIPGLFFL